MRSYLTIIGFVVLAGVLSVGVWAWVFLGDSRVLAEGDCTNADPVGSYDLTIHYDNLKTKDTYADTDTKIVIRVQGKMNHVYVTWIEDGVELSSDEIYDGDSTVYRRQEWATTYEQEKSDRYPSIRDVSADPFPYGKRYLCPDIEALGAEYQDTDETGKRYRIEGAKAWESFTFWTNDDGWLLRSEKDEQGSHIIISGIGEHNSIDIPPPPYRAVDSFE